MFSLFALVFTAVVFFSETTGLVVAFLVVAFLVAAFLVVAFLVVAFLVVACLVGAFFVVSTSAFVVGSLGTVDKAFFVDGAIDVSFVDGFLLACVLGFLVLSCVVDFGALTSVVGGKDDTTPVDDAVDSLVVITGFVLLCASVFWVDETSVVLLVDGFWVEGALEVP